MRHVESRRSRWITFALWLIIIQPAARAQVSTTGMINGTVSDPSGSAIAGAKVTITNSATGAASETVTNSTGEFAQVGLAAGQYQVAVTHSGFTAFKETGIALESV